MKIKIIIDKLIKETEVLIKAKEQDDNIDRMVKLIENISLDDKFILGYREYDAVLINLEDVNYFYTEAKKVYVNSARGVYEVRRRLYELETISADFLRISNSEIVRIKNIDRFDLKYSGTIMLRMKNKDELYVSRRYIPKIKAAFGIGG